MKNKLSDVRDHLVVMLEQLGDANVKPDVIERAKTTALVADKYIAAVKVEVDARKLYAEYGTAAIGRIDSLPALTKDV